MSNLLSIYPLVVSPAMAAIGLCDVLRHASQFPNLLVQMRYFIQYRQASYSYGRALGNSATSGPFLGSP